MTDKELRNEIYKWLYDNFNITIDKINTEKRNSLKKIMSEFSNITIQIKPVKKQEIKNEWKSYPQTK